MFFCTQLPTDVPDAVLSQLGARVQHAVRAFTPQNQQALTRTVKTYPKTDHYRLDQALTTLGTGEAIVTVLFREGHPHSGGLDTTTSTAVADGLPRRQRHP